MRLLFFVSAPKVECVRVGVFLFYFSPSYSGISCEGHFCKASSIFCAVRAWVLQSSFLFLCPCRRSSVVVVPVLLTQPSVQTSRCLFLYLFCRGSSCARRHPARVSANSSPVRGVCFAVASMSLYGCGGGVSLVPMCPLCPDVRTTGRGSSRIVAACVQRLGW